MISGTNIATTLKLNLYSEAAVGIAVNTITAVTNIGIECFLARAAVVLALQVSFNFQSSGRALTQP